MTTEERAAEAAAWDAKYAEKERIWSGNPNVALVREVDELPPGRALDLGCGEGADAIWLAGRGWRVTAVDLSRVALERAAAHAVERGVADRVEFRRVDLATEFPAGEYDLVSAQFLHSRGELPREEVLRRAAAAVAPGGVLLIEGHASLPAWETEAEAGAETDGGSEAADPNAKFWPHAHSHADMYFPTPDEVIRDLQLPEGDWEVLRAEEHERLQNDPDGNPTTRIDSTVKLRRLPVD
ncbi:SAM-dependent methyltransferase [Phaeacidiphilus oryzae]|uniref:SAM-dependent methyltransferase n=1 Tax=Phaeacidiphilus oryzae TaxID=348818 RepID=UPI00055D805C|nr:class I SAM-dependent methyltransferase [Phaeacidiphilus oryzae]